MTIRVRFAPFMIYFDYFEPLRLSRHGAATPPQRKDTPQP